MAKAKILCASSRAPDLKFCHQLAELLKIPIVSILSETQLEEELLLAPLSVLFWDLDAFDFNISSSSLSFQKMLPVIKAFSEPLHVFALANRSIFELPPVYQLKAVGHYLVRHYDEFSLNWIAKLVENLTFGRSLKLENLKDPDVTIQKLLLKSSAEKTSAVEAVGRVLEKRKLNARYLQMMLRNLDELLMNAIFNAPRDENDVFYRRDLNRHSLLKFSEQETVTLRMAFNRDSVTLSVLDQFGSFEPKDAWGVVRVDYQNKPYKLNELTQTGELGLGLKGIAGSEVALMISTKPTVETEAIFSFPYLKRFKESKNCFSSFSFN